MRYIPVVTANGVIWVPADELEWRERSISASHVNHVTVALGTGDWDRLREFEKVRVGGLPLVTDPQTIEELDDQGELDFDVFYWDPRRDR